MLSSPSHVIIGATRLERTERFLRHFGFEAEPEQVLPGPAAAALYGLEGATRCQALRTPGADLGWILLVHTPHEARTGGPYDARPVAIDLYTRDIHQSLETSRQAGAEIGELVEYDLGPLEIKEVEIVGPDHLVVVFIQVSTFRPSILDRDPDRLHSEIHSIVLAVQSADDVLPFWTGEAGLETLIDAKIEGPIISQLMGLPRPNVPVRFILLCDSEASPARFEFLEFFEDPGAEQPTWPLAAGLHAPAFTVADLERAMVDLSEAEFGGIVDTGIGRAVTAVAPGGVRFELWDDGATDSRGPG